MNIAIYCSARNDIDKKYFDDARQLGEGLARMGHTLVFGGGSVGLMGELARTYKREGGRMEGVITHTLVEGEVAFDGCNVMDVQEDMHLRKRELERRADAFIVLPGGIGTLDEFFATITQKHLGHHAAPIILFNSNGFYDTMLVQLEAMRAANFMGETAELFTEINNVDDLLTEVKSWSV